MENKKAPQDDRKQALNSFKEVSEINLKRRAGDKFIFSGARGWPLSVICCDFALLPCSFHSKRI